MKLRSSLLATVAIASLIAAGCGDDDDEPQPVADSGATGATGATGTSGPLSKTAFIKAADAICKEGSDSADDQGQELFPNVENPADLSPSEYEQLATEIVVPSLQSQLDQIRELTPPEGDEDAIEDIAAALEDGIAELEDDPSLLQEGGGPALEEASTLATDYGLKECGS